MSTATVTNPRHISTSAAGESITTRIQSIDVLRGLNMALMIFVNELAGVHGLPWWTYHAKTQWDVMTYVDMVFPVFLFLVGMSLPIAIAARLKKNPSRPSLWGHVIERSFSLWVLGLILANGSKGRTCPSCMVSAAAGGSCSASSAAPLFLLVPSSKDKRARALQGAARRPA